ncbi:MAG: glycosyltransferase family 4 protein [Candidatus Methanospirare jalkutatii]|nr:MAG: glycosyltransferase family 4 protein [Candidatus Methanospirare jalkutatii]UYZ40675.1 MAG: glycosyltransferase family 4 protein [Candidatus Methanospirare jalkutatii]
MKILYIAPDVPVPHTGEFLGGSTHVLKVAESLARRGCEVFIISRRMRGQRKYERISERIKTRRIYRGLVLPIGGAGRSGSGEKKKSFKFFENIYFIFYRMILTFYVFLILCGRDFDLVVERNSAKGIGVLPAKIFGVKAVVEVIDADFSRLQLKLADKILAYTKNIIPKEFHDKVVLTHAGVDAKFKPVDAREVREKYGLEGKKVVVYVGEMSEWHGADMLLDIAEKLKEEVKFLLLGKQLEKLKRDAEARGVADKFVFAGFVKHEEMPKFISAADVGIAPYKPSEEMKKHGFYFSPIKIFEYMACGKPVVASDLEIIRDIISANRCGLLAEPGNTEDFALKIEVLLRDEKMRERMGKNGRKAVLKYTWDSVADAILSDCHG